MSLEKGKTSQDQSPEEKDTYFSQARQLADMQKTDPVRAFGEIQTLAEKGSVNGMLMLGSAYQIGMGTPVNLKQAETWFRRAYEKGSVLGTWNLGNFYLGQKKYSEAYKAFAAGAAMGHMPSADYMHQLNDKENWEYWEKEPDLKQLWIVQEMRKTDPARAIEGLRALAEKGSSRSMLHLGWSYQKGIGVPADMAQAEKWFRLAYEKGPAKIKKEAAYFLGWIYFLRNDYAKAHELFSAGAAMDYPPAIYRLARMYRDGLGVEKQPDKARQLFEKASALGNLFAKRGLALQLLSGHFGFMNILRGLGLLLRSSKQIFLVAGKNPSSEQLRR